MSDMTTQPAMEGGGEMNDPRIPEYLWVVHNGEAMEFLTDTLRLVRVAEGWALAGPEGDIMLNDCHPDEASALRAVGAEKLAAALEKPMGDDSAAERNNHLEHCRNKVAGWCVRDVLDFLHER